MASDRASADPKDPDLSVSSQLLDRILDTVLAWEGSAADRSRDFVDTFLSHMPAKGFRNARSAPPRKQKEILKKAYRGQPEVAVGVLRVWRTIREDLVGAVSADLSGGDGSTNSVGPDSPAGTSPGEGGAVSPKEAPTRFDVNQEELDLMRTLLEWDAEGAEEHPMDPGVSVDRNRETSANLAVEAPVEAEPHGKTLPSPFEAAFALLWQVPAVDPCWDEIEAAVAELRNLAVSKQMDPARGRLALTARVMGISERFTEELTCLECALDPSEIQGIPATFLQDASNAIDQLEAVLDQYSEVRNQGAASRSAEKAKREATEHLEVQFDALRARWNDLVARGRGTGAVSGQPENSTAVEGAGSESSVARLVKPAQASSEESTQPGTPGDPPRVDPQSAATAPDGTTGDRAEGTLGTEAASGVVGPEGPTGSESGRVRPDREPESSSSETEAPGLVEPVLPTAEERRPDAAKTSEASLVTDDGPDLGDGQAASSDLPAGSPKADHFGGEVLQALAEGDTAGAYWLVRAQAAAGAPPVLPDWLLAAAHGASSLQAETGQIVDDLLATTRAESVPETVPAKLVALSAGLRGALLAPSSGLIAWLDVPRTLPGLTDLVEAVRAFAGQGQALGLQEARGLQGLEDRRRKVLVAASEGHAALVRASKHRFKLPRAAETWGHMLRNDLSAWFKAVAEDDRARVKLVREQAERWRDQDLIMNRIGVLDRELHGNRVGRIVGDARSQLLRNTWELCDLAEAWCRAVERLALQEAKGDWFQSQVSALRARCRETLAPAAQALHPLCKSSSAEGAAARCLSYTLADLAALLALEVTTDLPVRPALWHFLGEASSLEQLLLARLLVIPGLALDNEGRLMSDQLPQLPEALAKSRPLSTGEI
ncbi:MAG: hypothetical protein K8J08_05695, partial [Thermoanaerobaculia bacterium]|nr:hypothetical protein [Thermoanaerobaculia bacterium]